MADVNRLILKYAYPITFVILAILAWAAYRQFSAGGSGLIGYVVVILHRLGSRHGRVSVFLAGDHL